MLSPRLTAKEERAFVLAEDVLKLANGLVDAAIAVLAIERDRRIVQSYGIALLCRSISNFEGASTIPAVMGADWPAGHIRHKVVED